MISSALAEPPREAEAVGIQKDASDESRENDPEAVAIFEDMLKAYSRMKTFQSIGKLESRTMPDPGWKVDERGDLIGGDSFVWELPFKVVFRAPDELKVTWKERGEFGNDSVEVLFSRERQYYLYSERYRKCVVFDSLKGALVDSSVSPSFQSIAQPYLLAGAYNDSWRAVLEEKGLTYEGIESVGGNPCHKLEGKFPTAGTIWIDYDSFALVQTLNTSLQKKPPVVISGKPPRNWIPKPKSPIALIEKRFIEDRVTYKLIEIGNPIDDEEVDFELPSNIRIIHAE